MKPHLSEEQFSEWIAGQRGGEADHHLRGCPECAAEVDRTRNALLLFRDLEYQRAEFRPRQTEARTLRRSSGWALAGVAFVASVLAVVILFHKTELQTSAGQEIFRQIPYVVPPAPYERTTVVRMDVPIAALIAAGFRMDSPAADSVSADVVVGQDGRPLAVGFPETEQ